MPLRDSAPYRQLRKKGVTLAFGRDEVAGELVIRFPDGTFERTGLGRYVDRLRLMMPRPTRPNLNFASVPVRWRR